MRKASVCMITLLRPDAEVLLSSLSSATACHLCLIELVSSCVEDMLYIYMCFGSPS